MGVNKHTVTIYIYIEKKKLPPKSSTANFIPGLNISSSLFVEPLRFSDGIDLQWSAATSGSKANSKLFGLMPAYIQWKYHIIMYLLAIGEKGTFTFLTQDSNYSPRLQSWGAWLLLWGTIICHVFIDIIIYWQDRWSFNIWLRNKI